MKSTDENSLYYWYYQLRNHDLKQQNVNWLEDVKTSLRLQDSVRCGKTDTSINHEDSYTKDVTKKAHISYVNQTKPLDSANDGTFNMSLTLNDQDLSRKLNKPQNVISENNTTDIAKSLGLESNVSTFSFASLLTPAVTRTEAKPSLAVTASVSSSLSSPESTSTRQPGGKVKNISICESSDKERRNICRNIFESENDIQSESIVHATQGFRITEDPSHSRKDCNLSLDEHLWDEGNTTLQKTFPKDVTSIYTSTPILGKAAPLKSLHAGQLPSPQNNKGNTNLERFPSAYLGNKYSKENRFTPATLLRPQNHTNEVSQDELSFESSRKTESTNCSVQSYTDTLTSSTKEAGIGLSSKSSISVNESGFMSKSLLKRKKNRKFIYPTHREYTSESKVNSSNLSKGTNDTESKSNSREKNSNEESRRISPSPLVVSENVTIVSQDTLKGPHQLPSAFKHAPAHVSEFNENVNVDKGIHRSAQPKRDSFVTSVETNKELKDESHNMENIETDQKKKFLGFSSASGRKIKLSDNGLRSAQRLWDDIKDCSEENVNTEETDNSNSVSGKKRRLGERSVSCETVNTDTYPSPIANTMGIQSFQTHSRNRVKPKPFKKPRLLKEVNEEQNKTSNQSPSFPENARGYVGFKTASNKKVEINQRLLSNAKKLWDETETGNAKEDTSNENKKVGFKTASNKKVEINQRLLSNAKRLWDETETGNAKEDTSNENKKVGFKTASNKKVEIDQRLLSNTKRLWDQTEACNAKEDTSNENKKVGFKTASNKKVEIDQRLLSNAKKLWDETEAGNAKEDISNESQSLISNLDGLNLGKKGNANNDTSNRCVSPVLGSQKFKHRSGLSQKGNSADTNNVSKLSKKEKYGEIEATSLLNDVRNSIDDRVVNPAENPSFEGFTPSNHHLTSRKSEQSKLKKKKKWNTQETLEIDEITEAFLLDVSWDDIPNGKQKKSI